MKFSELNLHEKLLKGIEDAGYIDMMPVQEESLVHSLTGRDLEVQSQTGTGKTAAFLVTIFQHFIDENSPVKQKKALIIAPTRELAVQIEKEAKMLGKYLDYSIGSFYGGVGYQLQERLLQQDVDIIIGTPGRLIDFSQQKKMDLSKIGFLVIDEADRLLDMGFLPDIRKILRRMEGSEDQRQIMLFSATLDVNTRSIAREFMDDAASVEIEPEQITVDKITQALYHVSESEKVSLMLGILKKEMPKNALIFTNMKHTAAQVSKHLEYNGYKCQYLSGDLPQSKRLKIINKFKAGQLPFLVATDVAARGLHIDDLELIFNYDIPNDSENYVHRIGRTARAGKSGKAISLACERFVYNLEAIETFIGMKIPIVYAEEELFHEDKGAGMDFGKEFRGQGSSRSARGSRTRDKGVRKKTTRPTKGMYKKSTDQDEKKKFDPADSSKPKKTVRKKPRPDAQGTAAEKSGTKGKPYAKSAAKSTDRKDHKGQTDRPEQERPKKKHRGKKSGRSDKTSQTTIEDRLEYYKKKYGDNFKVTGEKQSVPKAQQKSMPKKSIFQKLKKIFKKK